MISGLIHLVIGSNGMVTIHDQWPILLSHWGQMIWKPRWVCELVGEGVSE